MKKIIVLIIVCVLSCSFGGCSGDSNVQNDTTQIGEEHQTEENYIIETIEKAEETVTEELFSLYLKDEPDSEVTAGEDKFIEGYEFVEKNFTASFDENEYRRCSLPNGRLINYLGEYEGQSLFTGKLNDGNGGMYVCSVDTKNGGAAQILFSLVEYNYSYNIGVVDDSIYFLCTSSDDNGQLETKLYKYNLFGDYSIPCTWVLPSIPLYYKCGKYIVFAAQLKDKCELRLYDTETGERTLIGMTDCTVNNVIFTGVSVGKGGAIDDKGFCYTISYHNNDADVSASKYSVYYYDFETGSTKYLYSPQHMPFFIRGDDRFVISAETVDEEPLKNPTTFYDSKSGEWGRIKIPGVELAATINKIKKTGEGRYTLCNNKSIYELDLDKRAITRYAITVEDIPEEWIIPGVPTEYMVNVQMLDNEEQTVMIDCVNQCFLVKMSDIINSSTPLN